MLKSLTLEKNINLTFFVNLLTNPLYILYCFSPFQEINSLKNARSETEGNFQYKSGNHFKSEYNFTIHCN